MNGKHTRRGLLALACGLTASGQQGWTLRLLRVADRVEVRVGGARGPLIQCCNYGCGATFCRSDPGNAAISFSGGGEVRLHGNPIGGESVIAVGGDTWVIGREEVRVFRR